MPFRDFPPQYLNCNTTRPALDSGLERAGKPEALLCHRHLLITARTCSAGLHGSQGVWSLNHLEVLLAPVVVIYTCRQWHPAPLFETLKPVCRPNNCFVLHLGLGFSAVLLKRHVSAFVQLRLHAWCMCTTGRQQITCSDFCQLTRLILDILSNAGQISFDLSEDIQYGLC